MSKEQLWIIEQWITFQIIALQKELDENYLASEEEAVNLGQIDVYSEIKSLLQGTTIVNEDYSVLRPV